jgi:hypothetical protein
MKNLAAVLTVVFITAFNNVELCAQISPPGGTNGGGGGTNYIVWNYTPPPYVPGLKLAIPPSRGSNFYINLLEADTAGTYAIFAASNLTGSAWSNTLSGAIGQTNFALPFQFTGMGFYRAARTDTPVTNTAGMTATFPNGDVNTNLISAVISGGPAAALAVLVNDNNLADAKWIPFSAVPNVLLGTNDGTYQVDFGFIGSDGQTNWTSATITLDKTPPSLTISGPANPVVNQPRIQLTGLSSEPLSSISYDITNSSGLATGQQVLLINQFYNTNAWEFTTNTFQAFDVPLTNGLNTITIHATDQAGNVSMLATNYTLNYSNMPAPVVQLLWPIDGDQIGGGAVTLRGQISNPTAGISGQSVGTNGINNSVNGLVERNGTFWLENMPLCPGTNNVTIIAVDAAGNTTTNQIKLVQNAVTIAIAPVPDSQLNLGFTTVQGTVSDPSYSVSVNGVLAVVDGGGNWTASNVPVNNGGTAAFNVTAYPPGGVSPVKQSLETSKDCIVEINHYDQFASITAVSPYTLIYQTNSDTYDWDYDAGGWGQVLFYVPPERGGPYSIVVNTTWPTNSQASSSVESIVYPNSTNVLGGTTIVSPITMEHCSPRTNGYSDVTYIRTANATVRLKTGGKGTSTANSVYVINANAQQVTNPNYPDLDASSPWPVTINPTEIEILGHRLDTNGNLFLILPDNTNLDVTPQIAQTLIPKYYTFNVSAAKYKLAISFAGQDVTDGKSTVVVGQLINPFCGWVGGGGPTITNYTWTIPGITFSDYVASANSGILYTDFPKTNSEVDYYWVDGGNKKVSCNASVMGQILTAQTTFNIVRPSASWVATIQDIIAVDNNYSCGTPFMDYQSWLHFGCSTDNSGITRQGIRCTADNLKLGGYTNSFLFFCVQVGNGSASHCQTNGLTVHNALSGEDTIYPDKTFPFLDTNTIAYFEDSPATDCRSVDQQVSDADSFDTYLMFQPATPSSPVPIKKISWNWSGVAIVNTASTNMWSLTSSNITITVNDNEIFSHPTWTTNLLPGVTTTNSICP